MKDLQARSCSVRTTIQDLWPEPPQQSSHDFNRQVARSNDARFYAMSISNLRRGIAMFEEKLETAVAVEDYAQAEKLRKEVEALRTHDPAIVVARLQEKLDAAVAEENYEVAARFRDEISALQTSYAHRVTTMDTKDTAFVFPH
jgi:excinuclease UvrABC nuclease subunit